MTTNKPFPYFSTHPTSLSEVRPKKFRTECGSTVRSVSPTSLVRLYVSTRIVKVSRSAGNIFHIKRIRPNIDSPTCHCGLLVFFLTKPPSSSMIDNSRIDTTRVVVGYFACIRCGKSGRNGFSIVIEVTCLLLGSYV